MSKPRLAVFELHHLGDAVMALPFLRGAKKMHAVTVVCRKPVADFLHAATTGMEIQGIDAGWRAALTAGRRLRLQPPDAAACVWADTRAHLAMRISGAGRRAGLPMTAGNYYAPHLPWRARRLQAGQFMQEAAAILLGAPLLTLPVLRARPDQHHGEDWVQLAAALGIEPDFSLPWIEPAPSTPPSNRVVLHPGGRLPTKRWPHFDEFLRSTKDLAVTIIVPPGEDAPSPQSPLHTRVSPGSWTELFSQLASARAVVCNDSFPAHLSAALGAPVVSIFGSGQPDWFSPWNNRHGVVATTACPHRPCIDRCVMPSIVCLQTVTPGMVETRLRSLLDAG